MKIKSEMFMRPIPPELGVVQCTIERIKSGTSKLWPKYLLKFFGQESKSITLLQASKIAQSKTPHYRIVIGSNKVKSTINIDEADYLGKLRSNSKKTVYQLFDSGEKPSRDAEGTIRRQYGHIEYGSKGSKKMQVFLPLISPNSSSTEYASWDEYLFKNEDLQELYEGQIEK